MARFIYEWQVNTYADGDDPDDPETDIVEVAHFDRVRDFWPLDDNQRAELVRTVASTGERVWADVEHGMLPSHFGFYDGDGQWRTSDVRVPQRFHREIAAALCVRA